MKTLLLFLSLIVTTSQAATVRLYFTDPLTNDKDTNAFYITPIGTNVLSSGGVVGRGVTTRYVPASNGYRTNTLAVGHYSITNRSLGSGVVIRVPDSSSLYDYTNILISGYNIFVTVTNGDSGTSGALTNNDTRAVTLTNLYNPKIRIVGIGDYVDFLTNESGAFSLATDNVTQPGLHVRNADFYAENIYATAGIFSGSGAGLTSVHGSNSITAGTISTNRMDATAYVAFNNDVTQAGLAAGSYAVSGNGRNLTNLFTTNMWMTTTLRAPWWTTEVFGSGYLHKMRDPNGNAFIQLRRDSSVLENNALYLGDFDNTNAWAAVTIQAASSRLNLDPRITFVFVGTLTNGSGAETVINPSWQFHETNFGADYINWDTLEHTRLDVITHNYSNTFWLGYTNFATILIGTNITASTNVTILGSLNPAGGIIGNRSVSTNANPQLNTLYTNTSKRAWFTTSISVAGGGDDNVLEVVTYAQGGATNRWSRIRLNDGVSTVFLDACFPISVPLNPNEVFYLDRISGLAGNYTINTNTWKIVSE